MLTHQGGQGSVEEGGVGGGGMHRCHHLAAGGWLEGARRGTGLNEIAG